MGWIQTYTGRRVDPLALKAEDICLEDIAHALGNLCRFNGHCPHFYSVAEHSVYVAELVAPEHRRCALLHDAAEAYIGDIVRPVKGRIGVLDFEPHHDRPIPRYMILGNYELKIHEVITKALGVCWNSGKFGTSECWRDIKRADEIMLATEARDLMGLADPQKEWTSLTEPPLPFPQSPFRTSRSSYLTPAQATGLWCRAWDEAGKAVAHA